MTGNILLRINTSETYVGQGWVFFDWLPVQSQPYRPDSPNEPRHAGRTQHVVVEKCDTLNMSHWSAVLEEGRKVGVAPFRDCSPELPKEGHAKADHGIEAPGPELVDAVKANIEEVPA